MITSSLWDSELASFLWCFFSADDTGLFQDCLFEMCPFPPGAKSADERCRTVRCRPDGMMGRRNKVRAVWCSHLFRSQLKGCMVINVDMCCVFDSLGCYGKRVLLCLSGIC